MYSSYHSYIEHDITQPIRRLVVGILSFNLIVQSACGENGSFPSFSTGWLIVVTGDNHNRRPPNENVCPLCYTIF